jgi:hypothetical protein
MSIDCVEWIVHCIGARIERMRVADELTREMLRRSYRQLALSQELLKLEVPTVCYFEAKTKRSSALSTNLSDGAALRSTASSPDV